MGCLVLAIGRLCQVVDIGRPSPHGVPSHGANLHGRQGALLVFPDQVVSRPLAAISGRSDPGRGLPKLGLDLEP
eukprot:14214046-Alexandrium_andersonii.AAC.1